MAWQICEHGTLVGQHCARCGGVVGIYAPPPAVGQVWAERREEAGLLEVVEVQENFALFASITAGWQGAFALESLEHEFWYVGRIDSPAAPFRGLRVARALVMIDAGLDRLRLDLKEARREALRNLTADASEAPETDEALRIAIARELPAGAPVEMVEAFAAIVGSLDQFKRERTAVAYLARHLAVTFCWRAPAPALVDVSAPPAEGAS